MAHTLRRMISPILLVGVIGLVFGGMWTVQRTNASTHDVTDCDIAKEAFCIAPRTASSIDLLHAATIPKIATPAWMQPVEQDDPAARTVTYAVSSRGTITADMNEFMTLTNQTLNDSRGWARLGVRFERVESGGDFTLYLSEASQMTTFSADGCDATYSCRVGNSVIINQDRWLSATPSWTQGGGSLAEYRHMVVNHEVGHWLGHGHTFCSVPGQPATVMQQQSMSLQGCAPNAWPLASELYAPNLGIRS